MTDVHALVRTSPKGGPFIGRCMKCGKADLAGGWLTDPCVNPSGMTDTAALLSLLDSAELANA